MALTNIRVMRYGWIIVGIGALSIAFHTVVGYSNALFLVPIADTNGWSRMVVSASLSAYSLGMGLCAKRAFLFGPLSFVRITV